MWLALFFGGLAVLFLVTTLKCLFHLQWVQRLPALTESDCALPAGSPNPGAIQCSVVVAARDEESRIEKTISHVLAQHDVQLEVIVVNDRSQDGTEEALRRIAENDNRLRILTIRELPYGWLGKCNACHLGAAKAEGEWILFTDADCWLKPDLISRALRVAEREKVDHITLTPGIAAETAGARAWHLAFLISLLDWVSGVNRDRPKAYLGIGAFNLVRTAAYRQCGGYEALRMTVLDDVKLGLLLRRAGMRTRAFLGGNDVQCNWGSSVKGMVDIMEKNYFAAVDYRLAVAVGAGLSGMLGWCAAILGPLTGTAMGLAAGVSLLSLALPAFVLSRRLGWGGKGALLTPFIFPALFYAMLNSTWKTIRQGGVRWRDTFYSLAELRAGTVR